MQRESEVIEFCDCPLGRTRFEVFETYGMTGIDEVNHFVYHDKLKVLDNDVYYTGQRFITPRYYDDALMLQRVEKYQALARIEMWDNYADYEERHLWAAPNREQAYKIVSENESVLEGLEFYLKEKGVESIRIRIDILKDIRNYFHEKACILETYDPHLFKFSDEMINAVHDRNMKDQTRIVNKIKAIDDQITKYKTYLK